MPSTLENPFTPKSALPTKRLFGGGEKHRRKLSIEAKKRLEDILVEYGGLKIKKSQAEFLSEMGKELIGIAKEKGRKLSKEDVKRELVQKIVVDKLGNIQKIFFRNMRLEKLPNLDNLTNLQRLVCENNQLTSLPNLDKLTNLQDLDCYGNQLTSLPNLDKLTNLKELNCLRNQLTSLPNLDKLTNLQLLYCYDNQLTSEVRKKIRSQVPKNCHLEI